MNCKLGLKDFGCKVKFYRGEGIADVARTVIVNLSKDGYIEADHSERQPRITIRFREEYMSERGNQLHLSEDFDSTPGNMNPDEKFEEISCVGFDSFVKEEKRKFWNYNCKECPYLQDE